MNKQTIAVFDFDGTLIKKNTLINFFVKMYPLKKSILSGILLSPSIFLYLIGKISNKDLKEKMLCLYLGNTKKEQFARICNSYTQNLNKIENKDVLNRLLWHKNQGHIVLIISASLEDWIRPWAKQYDIEVLATKLEEKNEILTGKILGQNCYGPEKVKRLLEKYPDLPLYTLCVYGDGDSDKDILKIANYPHKGNFNALKKYNGEL